MSKIWGAVGSKRTERTTSVRDPTDELRALTYFRKNGATYKAPYLGTISFYEQVSGTYEVPTFHSHYINSNLTLVLAPMSINMDKKYTTRCEGQLTQS